MLGYSSRRPLPDKMLVMVWWPAFAPHNKFYSTKRKPLQWCHLETFPSPYRYDYKSRQALREDYLGPLPELFKQLAERLTAEGHFQAVPDQVIINEYKPGQGISAHIDCQPCFGATIASLSLLSACVMGFASQTYSQQMDLHLQPASLLVLKDDARHLWTHGVKSRKSDVIAGQKHHRSRRISLTFRTMKFKTL